MASLNHSVAAIIRITPTAEPMPARKAKSKEENPNLSGGPTTDKGKAVAAQNSRKHGLTARNPRWTDEELETIDRMALDLVATYQAKGPAEKHLLRDLAVQMMRQKRLDSYVQLLTDRQQSANELRSVSPSYPSTLSSSFRFFDIEDEVRHLTNLQNNLPTSSDGWKGALIEYMEKFIDHDFESALEKSPIVKAIARHDGSGAPRAIVEQAITDRLAQLQSIQQQQQQLEQMDAAIALHEVEITPNVETIQHSINRQIKVAVNMLKELQTLRLTMATGGLEINTKLAKHRTRD